MKSNLRPLSLCALLAAMIGFMAAPLHLQAAASGDKVKVTGEVVDLMCYLDHGAKGEGHAACARKCISSNGPVGLLADDGELYLLIGDHAPANDRLADYAAKTITVEGKYVERNGMKMVENIHILD